MSDGRIFLVQVVNGNGNPYINYTEVYYSDNEGATWTRSTNDSRSYTTDPKFSEGKVIETSTGTLAWYTSWSDTYNCMVYSESTDNGVTWGALHTLPNLKCARSSFAVYEDTSTEDMVYYMTWVYDEYHSSITTDNGQCRSRLSLARSYDGINWEYLGDVYRWQSSYTVNSVPINHIVDPFITVTDDYIYVGSGFSEKIYNEDAGDATFHHAQREHIVRIDKASLAAYNTWPSVD